jgi:histidyl-tRNA synthetase
LLTSLPRGTVDILPEEVGMWHHIRRIAEEVCSRYGYGEIVTPYFEHTELFVKTTGDTSDIVTKEMYTFFDRQTPPRSLTLRPEGTPGVGRAYLEHKLYSQPQPSRFFYFGPMFRYERPQAGRQRQFHQFGVEIFGSESFIADAEVITLAVDFLRLLGMDHLTVTLNSIGCPECRPAFRQEIVKYFKEREELLCEDCRARLDRNPLRVLDCKKDGCRAVAKDAPRTIDFLCDACNEQFRGLKSVLESERIPFTVNPYLVRGLDYYTRTVFEVTYPDLGAQNAILGGGRYDGLIESLGGERTPAVGWAMGLERLIMTLNNRGIGFPADEKKLAYVITTPASLVEGFKLTHRLREAGLRAEIDVMGRSFKAQMKQAGRLGADYAVFLGDDELARGSAGVRLMAKGEQHDVPIGEIIAFLTGVN